MDTVLGNSEHVARKPHICIECGGRIEPGQKYRRQRGIYDGDPYTYKGHVECSEASLDFVREFGLSWDEVDYIKEWFEVEDLEWLRDNHPIVYDRIDRPLEKNEEEVYQQTSRYVLNRWALVDPLFWLACILSDLGIAKSWASRYTIRYIEKRSGREIVCSSQRNKKKDG